MKLSNLRDLLVAELQDLYDAENQITKALPKMAKTASSPELKRAFETHLEQTQTHISRLERVFATLDEPPKGKKCKGMEGLLKEGDEMIKEDADPDVKDAGLISAAQRVEHYEMAGYGTVRTYAQILGNTEAQQLLQQTLNEEGETDHLLTRLAEQGINLDAAAGSSTKMR
jgi:ferritin-like metal-binding protein YciE